MIRLLSSSVKLVRLCRGGRRWLEDVRLLSYKHKGGEWPLSYKTIGDVLNESAEAFGSRTAYVSSYQDKRISFKEAREQADTLASGMLAMGIEKGDRVGLWAPNSLEWYVTSLALARAGIISVYLNPLYQAREVQHCINSVGIKMLITTETFKTQNYSAILDEVEPEILKSTPGKVKSKVVPTLESVVCISENDVPGMISFQRLMESGTEDSRNKLKKLFGLTSPDEASNIQFTSGTTGFPKGAVISHFHIVNNSNLQNKRLELCEMEHTMCFMGPLFHAMGCVLGILNCLQCGTTLVIPEATFSPSNAIKAIEKEKCTILLGTPTMYIDMIKIVKEKGLKITTPKLAIMGGSYAPVQLFLDIREKLGVERVASVYGLTETGPITFMSTPKDTFEQMTKTVGYLMEYTEAKVVDDKGMLVPWGAPGELWVRGYNVMKGYWGDEKKTKETITEEHWFRTGDQFAMTEDGYGRVVGRIKDMIIRGGENIYPAEIEEYLSSHPEIVDAQVVGVPDKRLGEQVCACIRLVAGSKLKEDDIKNFCKGKMADFKIPYYILIIDEFPKTPSGKVQKFILRTQATEMLKLNEEK